MVEKVRNLSTLDRCGNAIALDFVNTVHSRSVPDPHEYLQNYGDLVQWARDGRLLSADEHRRLGKSAKRHADAAALALTRGLQLRELLYEIFSSTLRGKNPAPDDVSIFNNWLSAAMGRRRVSRTGDDFQWSWYQVDDSLDRPLWPVVLSAADLLADGGLRSLKECPVPEGCGWLFLDVSKNRKRKWCNMKTCGNVIKARRYYQRHSKTKANK